MDVGDLVWVRFFVYDPDSPNDAGLTWVLGTIVKDDQYQAGLYKIHIFKYNKIEKLFINDIRPLDFVPTI